MLMPGRQYLVGNNYRYSINGQENTPEIAPNATTAEFWQYNAKIGRRWNVDPKPNIAISPFSVFADNPIRNSDIKGDSIWVVTDGGTRLYYQNNKLYRENGKVYKGWFQNSFAKQMRSDLNKIAEGEFGSQWIEEMVNMQESVEIHRSKMASADAGDTELTGYNHSSGNKAIINDGSLRNPKLPTSNGLEEIPRFVALGHELFHAYGSAKGSKNLDPWYMNGDKKILKDEFFACIVENWIRADHGLAIRTHYSNTIQNGKEVPNPASALFQRIWRLPPPCEGLQPDDKGRPIPCNPSDGIIFYEYLNIWKLIMK